MEKDVYIWGVGLKALRFMCNSIDETNFVAFIESEPINEKFVKWNVLKFEEITFNKNSFIWIATGWKSYKEIKELLKRKGFVEFEDFANTDFYNKEIVIVHGNCHTSIIKKYLESSDIFKRKYAIYPTDPIQVIHEEEIEKNILKRCSVIFSQDIRKENPYGYKLGYEYIFSCANENCIKVVVPNLYGMGRMIFPQSGANKNNPERKGFPYGMFPAADRYIDTAYEKKGKDISFVDILEEPNIEDVIHIKNIYLDKLHARQRKWSIDIESFILDNFQEKQLFYDYEHPTNIVLKEIASRLLNYIGICDNDICCESSLSSYETPIYPKVKDILHLKYNQDNIRKSEGAVKLKDVMDIKEYIREYLLWCYGSNICE